MLTKWKILKHKIRLFLEKNETLKKFFYEKDRRRKIRQYIRKFRPSTLELIGAFRECYELHRTEFQKLYELLEDDFSRRTLHNVIEYRLTGRTNLLRDIVVSPQYFVPDIIGPLKDEVFIDGGAYTGDTIASLYRERGKCWRKIYAWEPDYESRMGLTKTCKDYKDVEIIPFGLWNEKTELKFIAGKKHESKVSENGTEFVPVDTIDHVCASDKVTFIKMDIEGAELEALRGAADVIRRDKPKLAISIYHKPKDYFEIPFFVKELVPEYRLYIRHHKMVYFDTVLYAVFPENQGNINKD